MDTTQIDVLVDEIVKLTQTPENWLAVNESRCRHVSGKYSLYIERMGDTKQIYRVNWQFPEKIAWERKQGNDRATTPGFDKIAEACDTLFNFFRERLCEFTISYIHGNWHGFKIGGSSSDAEKEAFRHYQWLMKAEGIEGLWYWAHDSEILWFEYKDDAALFKLARLGETQE